VPFRQSKLTSVLRDSLGGNCKTTMIANIWLEAQHADETISTLRFATRMMRVSNEAVLNVEYDPAVRSCGSRRRPEAWLTHEQVLCKKYEREIAELKKELVMRDALAGRSVRSVALSVCCVLVRVLRGLPRDRPQLRLVHGGAAV
jgi:kinesin family protein 6/9